MRRLSSRTHTALLLAGWLFVPAREVLSEDWTRFRGPNGLGVSDVTNLPVTFGPQENVIWKTPLPPEHSSPVFRTACSPSAWAVRAT